MKQLFAPFIGQLDAAFHQAFALGIGQTFLLAVGACVVAVLFALGMKDIPLRKSFAPEAAPAAGAKMEPAAGRLTFPRSSSSPRPRHRRGLGICGTIGPWLPSRDPRPLDFRPELRALGTDGAAVPAAARRGRTCRRARCAGSRSASSTSSWPTPTEGIVAVDDRCPHMSAPLSIGALEGCVVACPLHEGPFDLCSGDPVRMPTTGGLDPDGRYHPTWSSAGREPKVDPPGTEGRGAPADPRAPLPLLPASGRRRLDRGRPAELTARARRWRAVARGSAGSAELVLDRPVVLVAGVGLRREGLDHRDGLGRVVRDVEEREIRPRRSCGRAAGRPASSRRARSSTPARAARPGSGGSCRSG